MKKLYDIPFIRAAALIRVIHKRRKSRFFRFRSLYALERDLRYDKDIAYTTTWNNIQGEANRKRFYLHNFEHNYSETFAAAVDFRELKIKELIAQGMSYTPRHGK